LQFTESFPVNNPNQITDFDNISADDDDDDDDDDMMSESTTLLIDDDDDDDQRNIPVQQQEISSSTSTIVTLNAINMFDLQKENLWILQPALNSVYNSMDSVPTCHLKKSTGSYQMEIDKPYNNAILTPLCKNTCLVPPRDRCLLETLQTSLHFMMIAMKRYSTLNPIEKASLNLNFGYLGNLISKIEEGFRERDTSMYRTSIHE